MSEAHTPIVCLRVLQHQLQYTQIAHFLRKMTVLEGIYLKTVETIFKEYNKFMVAKIPYS
jgi:hypothetical protein